MNKNWIAAIAIVLLLGSSFLMLGPLEDYAVRRQALSAAGRFQTNLLTDGRIHVIIVGSGSPAPDAARVQSCVAVIADGSVLLFDAGGASAYRAELLGLPLSHLHAVFLTHLHSDHIADVPLIANASWRQGRKHTLPVYGPRGTMDVVNGFNQSHKPDLTFRYAKMKEVLAPVEVALPVGRNIPTPASAERSLVYESDKGFKVFAFLVEHPPVAPAFGYRIEIKGRIIVISGDTRRCENLVRHAKGADILIHEAFNKKLVEKAISSLSAIENKSKEVQMMLAEARDVQDYHTTPVEAAQTAARAGVNTLVFTHIIPPLGRSLARFFVTERLFMQGVEEAFSGKVIIAEDGTRIDLSEK